MEAQSDNRELGGSPKQCCCRIAGIPASIGERDAWSGFLLAALQAMGPANIIQCNFEHSGFSRSVFLRQEF